MQYEFEHLKTGEYAVMDIHPDDVCRIGETQDGHRRIPSIPVGAVRRNVAFVSRQFDEEWHGEGPDPAPRRDELGRPVFHNRKEAIEFGRRTGSPYDEL